MKKLFTLLTLALINIGSVWATGEVFYVKFQNSSSVTQSTANYFSYDKGSGVAVSWSSKGKHSCTYGGDTYSDVIKMESATQCYFTSEAEATITIVQTISNATGDKLKFDGTNLNSEMANTTVTVNSTDKYNEYVITKVAAGTHTITRQSETGLAYVKVEYTGEASVVVADPVIAWNSSNSQATITCSTDGATIYYTTDGSEPTTSSASYSSAITLTNSSTVRAFAKKSDVSSNLVKRDCFVSHSSVEKYLTSLGYNGGTVSGDVWTGTNFTITNNVADRGFGYVNLAGSQDGFKLNHTDSYTIQPSEGIKVTKLVVVGKTWLQGDAGNASTIAFDDWTPAAGTFFDYLTDGETYVKTIEFTPDAEQTYGQAITMRPGTNQLGAYIEVYGTIKTYTVTYNAGANGTGSIAAGEKTYGAAFTLSSSTFTRDGYVQTGWATSDGGPQLYALGGSYTANADVTLYPVWAEGGSIVAFNYEGGKTISELEALGWTFNSSVFDGDPTDAEAYVNLVSAFTTAGITAPGTNGMADNAIAFAKNASAYAMYDLGAAKTITAVNATLYGGSSASFNATIEYVGSDGSTVKKSNSSIALNAGNWLANNISLTDEVSGVRYIKIYGASKWMVMYNLSVTYKESVSVSTLAGRNYASYITSEKLDFGSAEGITAYIATGLNSGGTAVELLPVDVVSAGTAVIVKTDTKGATVNVPVSAADPSSTAGNALVPGDGTTAWNGTAGYTYYYIANDQFYKATSGTLKSGKAYLKVDNTEVPAPVLNFVFGDVTGIADVRSKMEDVRGDFFDLQGRKVAQPTKGLYIVNGKKVIIK